MHDPLPDESVVALQLWPPRLMEMGASVIGTGGVWVISARLAVRVAGDPIGPPLWLAFRETKVVSFPATHRNPTGAEVIVVPFTTANAVTLSVPGNTPE